MKTSTIVLIFFWILLSIVGFRNWVEIINQEFGLLTFVGLNIAIFVYIAISEGQEIEHKKQHGDKDWHFKNYEEIVKPKGMKRKYGTIGFLNGKKIIEILRKIPPNFQYKYDHGDKNGDILAEEIIIRTEKGLLRIKSCNNCDILYCRYEENASERFE